MAIIDQIKMLAKKTTGKDISGETIQEALNNFEKAVNTAPTPAPQATPAPRYEKRERKTRYAKTEEE